jgi:UDP-2,3-diacylglucosamine hydrolase
MSMGEKAYFISDAHLGAKSPGNEAREQHLTHFLRSLEGRARYLYILGDLFDFWIEYTHAIRPAYFNVLRTLRCLVESGTEIHYLAGNHDFALGPFLEKTIGIRLHRDHYTLSLQGKNLHLHHGDGLVASELGYRLLRAVLRNPVNLRLYKLLHPDIGIPLACFFSYSSRNLLGRSTSERKREQYRRCARSILSRGADIVIFAHTHSPELRRFGTKTYCNTGEWIRRYTFASLEDGVLSLWEYFSGRAVQPIAADSDAMTGSSVS